MRQEKERDGKNRRERKEDGEREREREKRERERERERERDYSEDRSNSSIRIKEESLMADHPPSKRLMLDDDVSLNMRMTPIGLPGANIKITSRGPS